MATTIKLKNGSGAPAASDLVQGEPALDLTNKRLYSENSGGAVIEIGTNPSALSIAGVAVTSTAAELNILDGVTATATELNIMDGVTATTAELNILDGVTATASELNIMDGVTASTAELNIMDGVTSSTAELNVLDGVTAFLDEDDMASDSATGIPSQQSVKAYVQGQVGTSGGGSVSYANLVASTSASIGGGTTNGVYIAQGGISIKNGGSQSYVDFYCESSNAHYARLQSAAHADYAGNITLTLPSSTDTLVGRATTDTLTNKSLTAPVLTGSSSSAGSILFKEDTDNGTNAVTLKGPESTADITLVLPNSTGSSGQAMVTDGSGNLSFATVEGAYSAWSIKTSSDHPYTASHKDQLIINSASAFTVTLPSSPSAGNTVIICNAGAGTVTVGRNSSNINSAAEDGSLPQGNSVQLVYVDSTIGWFEI
tara:strand:- start:1484 stop:2770 length:1287 start_codon:yes stop_codon:yes gene_type:complete